MTFKVLLPTLLLFFLISSCAKTPGKTDAKFKLSIASLTDLGSAGAGGAMLWGKSDKGDMFGVQVSMSSGLSLELTNGTWTFWSVAWEGKNNIYNFQGLTRCAKLTSVFNGSDSQININLSNATCADPDFSPAVSTSAGVYSFPVISRRECDKLSEFNGTDCGLTVGSSAKSTSRRLMMPSFKKASGGSIELTGSALVSACHAGNESEMIDTRLPVGNGVIPAFTVLESFFTSTLCDETDPKGFVKENFEMGLKATNNPNAMAFINNGSCNGTTFSQASCSTYGGTFSSGVCSGLATSFMSDISESVCIAKGGTYTSGTTKKLRLITAIPDNVFCSGKRIDPNVVLPHVFASGNGLPTNPYRICKEYQLNNIGGTYANNNFALNADLDMNATSVFGDQPIPACFSSRPGANFIPIGGMFDSNCNEIAETSFGVGAFHGRGHTISNIRLHSKLDNIGFIRSGGSIYNLTLNNVEMEGADNVGALSGSTSGVLSNLLVKKAKIRGRDAVGGIVGEYTPSAGVLSNVHVKKGFVQIDASTLGRGGGLVGETNNLDTRLTINKSSFEGVVDARGNHASAGGLVGAGVVAPLTINESFSSGALIVHGSDWTGGLVGNASAGFTISNSYSRMNMGPATFEIGESGKIGGLVGNWGGSEKDIVNSFYYGSIMHPCKNEVGPCSIGALTGASPVTTYNSYGALISNDWNNGTAVTGATELANFESNATKNAIIQYNTPALFKNTGASFVRLSWESDTCAMNENNLSVALQSATKGSLINPIVLCNKEQWAEIKNYPSLHYIVADNLGIGDINSTTVIPSFSGSLNGNGFVIAGIGNLLSTTTSGIISNNYGKISNAIFANSYLKILGNQASAGLVKVNHGQITDNQFLSVNILSSTSEYTGVVAGENYGNINRNKISSISSISRNGGLLVGTNMGPGVMTGNRIDGVMKLFTDLDNDYFGLVAAYNSGRISETDVSGSLINNVDGNTRAGSSFGIFLGVNNGIVEDILIRPTAKLIIGINGPTYGQVFGEVLPGAVVENVLALNEISLSDTAISANVQSFAGFSDPGSLYKNSYIMKGSVYRYSSTPVIFTNCTQSAYEFTYSLSAALALSPSHQDGFYFPGANSSHFSSRITANLTNGVTSFVSNIENGDFALPCDSSGIISGSTTLYPIFNEPDFSDPEVHVSKVLDLKRFNYFCPSSTAVSSSFKPFGECNTSAGELNMVEDAGASGFGFQRLLNAHKTWLQTGYPPDTRPIWVMSDDGYPKLFITD